MNKNEKNILLAKYDQLKEDYDKLLSQINTIQNSKSNTNKEVKYFLNDSWLNWISENLNNNIPPKKLAQILIKENFSIDIISEMLKLEFFPNPAKTTEKLLNTKGMEKINVDFPLFRHKKFLSKKESNGLIKLIKLNSQESTIHSQAKSDTTIRKSNSSFLETLNDPLVNEIKNRLCKLVDIDLSFTESIQGQHYEKGGFYHEHWDASRTTDNDFITQIENFGNRTWTAMINLNIPEEGGETHFFKPDLTIEPEVGQLLFWYNLNVNDYKLNESTGHGGKPVKKGEKFIITQWFRQFNNLNI